ncbi:STAS domain-containing protein [Nonomuraea aridisoli]|nr:STAS domain-containing protein [Nonomuraea aridisoli]
MTVLTVDLVHHPAHSVLTLHGELDFASSDRVPPLIDAVVKAGRRRLVVDTVGLTFCDSRGLRALIHAERALAALGGGMELVNVHGRLLRLLDITGLTGVLAITTGPGAGQAVRK